MEEAKKLIYTIKYNQNILKLTLGNNHINNSIVYSPYGNFIRYATDEENILNDKINDLKKELDFYIK